MAIAAGTTRSTSRVETIRPKTMVTAIGMMNCACRLVSNISGVSPPMVVSEVRMTARSRSRAPSMSAARSGSPRRSQSSMLVTRMIESLTTIPDRPTSATMLRIVRSKPSSQWPSVAPTKPTGITDITTIGRV